MNASELEETICNTFDDIADDDYTTIAQTVCEYQIPKRILQKRV